MHCWNRKVGLLMLLVISILSKDTHAFTSSNTLRSESSDLRKDFVNRSVNYYSKLTRERRRRSTGQAFPLDENPDQFSHLAVKHYFAYRKIRDGEFNHAEVIYRRIIQEIMSEDEDGHCDHAKLAVTTLLLALHCQRMGQVKKARSVFLDFFRVAILRNDENIDECACSAKVLGAYAIFEMKQGHISKSYQIAQKAVELDAELKPLLKWKQFEVVQERDAKRAAEY